ncbi:MAG TPA: hypothetical protein VHJ56_02965, partial [Candidatus Binatia bacterium]|nr:hypothetical protein [Candidatus Binatia bacterium]
MPYGSLGAEKLSQASRIGLEKAADWWQKSMQTSKHKTYFVLAGYDDDAGQEIHLRKQALHKMLNGQEPELLNNIFEVSANNEVGLAQKITHVRDLLP